MRLTVQTTADAMSSSNPAGKISESNTGVSSAGAGPKTDTIKSSAIDEASMRALTAMDVRGLY